MDKPRLKKDWQDVESLVRDFVYYEFRENCKKQERIRTEIIAKLNHIRTYEHLCPEVLATLADFTLNEEEKMGYYNQAYSIFSEENNYSELASIALSCVEIFQSEKSVIGKRQKQLWKDRLKRYDDYLESWQK